MIDAFIHNAPLIGLLIFFLFFCLVLVWMARPGMKRKLESHARIPLEEDRHGR